MMLHNECAFCEWFWREECEGTSKAEMLMCENFLNMVELNIQKIKDIHERHREYDNHCCFPHRDKRISFDIVIRGENIPHDSLLFRNICTCTNTRLSH